MTDWNAVIDLGSNSFKLAVGRTTGEGELPELKTDRMEVCRLSKGMDEGELAPDAVERAMEALRGFSEELSELNIPTDRVTAVGTEALRLETAGSASFAEQVREEFGWNVEVISAQREAELAYRACRLAFPDADSVIDQGGGSLDLGWSTGGGFQSVSLPLGTRVSRDRWEIEPPLYGARRDDIMREMRAEIRDELEELGDNPVAIGGTATTLWQLSERKSFEELGHPAKGELSLTDVRTVENVICRRPVEEIAKSPYVHERRADVICAGALLFHAMFDVFKIDTAGVTTLGLRHALL